MEAIPTPPQDRSLRPGTVLRLDPRVASWSDGSVLIGGSPWRVSRLAESARTVVDALTQRGERGLAASDPHDLRIFRQLVDRGFAYAQPPPRPPARDCSIVVPAMDRTESLDRCLASLDAHDVTVIDDGSLDAPAVGAVATRHGARLVPHSRNRGPAAARNTGLAQTVGEFVAFLDSDCIAPAGWPQSMLHHFDDPTVAAVAPRVRPSEPCRGVIERYEATRSSLDMGRHPELVRPGSRLGFVPTAALILRRAATDGAAFDETLRLGEDVDLVWRLTDAGWHVRYDPTVIVRHETRSDPRLWLRRRFEYGTSAAALASRHPGKLAPARVSAWNMAGIALLAARRPVAAGAVMSAATATLARQLAVPRGPLLAARVVGQGLFADAAGIGHLLRREWWPIGATALVLAPRSRLARVGVVCMLAPIAWECLTQRPALDPARYAAIRLVDDAAYGTGVLIGCLRARSVAPLAPTVRLPHGIRLWKARRLPK